MLTSVPRPSINCTSGNEHPVVGDVGDDEQRVTAGVLWPVRGEGAGCKAMRGGVGGAVGGSESRLAFEFEDSSRNQFRALANLRATPPLPPGCEA